MADDMGYSDVGCWDGEISTPNIDRLAEKGVLLLISTTPSAACPSRASLLTGLYLHKAGIGKMICLRKLCG